MKSPLRGVDLNVICGVFTPQAGLFVAIFDEELCESADAVVYCKSGPIFIITFKGHETGFAAQATCPMSARLVICTHQPFK